jgi:23S rRNA pseudouridine1911/1915/1917 synthase
VYEDDTLLLINKLEWWFILVTGITLELGTLLAYHFDNLPMNSSERPGLVHRIDKDTSVSLGFAKTEVTSS